MDKHIIVAKSDAEKFEEFKELMSTTNNVLGERAAKDPKKYKSLNGTALESIVCGTMKELCGSTSFRSEDIKLKSGQSFPDIITTYFHGPERSKHYGVEVKTTKENKWVSTGSSIVESSRIVDVNQIMMLFGKLGDPIEFKCRPYEECLSGIAVTHSPRYLIDMNLAIKDSIFAKMNTDYNTFRNAHDNIDQVRQYYIKEAAFRNKMQMPWWMNGTTSVNISFFSDLDRSTKSELVTKALIFFEEALGSDYKRVSLWLCSRYSVLVPNVRDLFSAGGKCFAIDGEKLKKPYPQIVKRLLLNVEQIKLLLTNPTEDLKVDLLEFWETKDLQDDLFMQWIERVELFFSKTKSLEKIPIRKLIEDNSKVTK